MRRSIAWRPISPPAVSWLETLVSLADISLLAYTRVAHEGGFDLGRFAAIRRWIGDTEAYLGLPSAR